MKRENQKSELEMIDDSRRSGRRLAASFADGAEPPQIDVPLAMQRGEFCAGQFPVQVHRFIESDGSYLKKTGGFVIGGGILGAAISTVKVTSNVVGNARRRAKAAREAAGQWQHVETGTMFLTSMRWP